ncbi:hypothetical protein [Bacteroides sp. 224]|nr:hypothetical protein [Bacteroides sp. 224]
MNYSFEIKDLLFSQEDYETLKTFWAKLIEVNNGMVVLKKG